MVRGDIRETTRTLESKLGWPNSLTAHFEKELRAHFSAAWIGGYESLIPSMTNGCGASARCAQSFLIEIFRQEQAVVMTKLEQQAADRGRSLRQLLDILNGTVLEFAWLVTETISKE